jgi:hypothetical protein
LWRRLVARKITAWNKNGKNDANQRGMRSDAYEGLDKL